MATRETFHQPGGRVTPSATSARAGLRERKKARTRALIQEHALRLFSARGYEATTAEQIAEAAEISPSTLFRYFATKADIIRYDALDPLIFDAYRTQPPELSPISALRQALRSMLETLPAHAIAEELRRARLVVSVPELRALMLNDSRQVSELWAEAETARTGRAPDPFAMRILVGALGGAIVAALETTGDDAAPSLIAVLDRMFALAEAGLPLHPETVP